MYEGSRVSFESTNYPGRFIRPKNYRLWIDPNDKSDLFQQDATFRQRPGLADGTLDSFESIHYPGYFIRHKNYQLWLDLADGSDLFKQDATFRQRPGLADATLVSFESINYPGYFIRHKNYQLWIDPDDGSDLFKHDATFRRLPGMYVHELESSITLTRMYLSSRYWRFSRADGTVLAQRIQLRRDGTIEGYANPNEARWVLECDTTLSFCREDGVVTTRFGIERSESPTVLSGRFLFDENIQHLLIELQPISLPKRQPLPWILVVRPNLGQPLLLASADLGSFEITFAGTSTPPAPSELLRMLQAPSLEQAAVITVTLDSDGHIIIALQPYEVVEVLTYPESENRNPPRTTREFQYFAGFRWEARVRLGLTQVDITRLSAQGLPRLFDLVWWHPGETPIIVPHSVYVSELHQKQCVSFLHVTDLHVSGCNDLIPEVLAETRSRYEARQLRLRYTNFNDNLRAVIRFANEEKVDFVVMTGDLVDFYHDGVMDKIDDDSYFQDYLAGERGERGGWLGQPPQATSNVRKFVDIITGRDGRGEKLWCPVFCVLGNHDYLLMEYPTYLEIDLFWGIPLSQIRRFETWGLSEDEANEYEFWKRNQGDTLPERSKRRRTGQGFDTLSCEQLDCVIFGKPDFEAVNYSQYLTEISYDTDYVIRVGKHRLVCLNTGEDIGIPDSVNDITLHTGNTLENHFLDDQSHNRGIVLSQYELINQAVLDSRAAQGLALAFTHAPILRERDPGKFDKSMANWNEGKRIPGDLVCMYLPEVEDSNSLTGMDGCVADWDILIPVPKINWLQTGASGLDAIFSGHSHDVREYRFGNGVQVCKGDYSGNLSLISETVREQWLKDHRPLQIISGSLKRADPQFRHIVINRNHLDSFSMREINPLGRQEHLHLPYFFTALSLELARYGGYEVAERNDPLPATHLKWAVTMHHLRLVLWDLMEKYGLQISNIEYLEALLQLDGRNNMPKPLQDKLKRAEDALAAAILPFARILRKYPATEWWFDPKDPWERRRNQFYALAAAGLNTFGLDFGSSEKNSLDPKVHYDWARDKVTDRLKDALEERIGKIFEFCLAGSLSSLALWFAAESTHLAPWAVWTNAARDSRDPAAYLRWALSQNGEGILGDLCEKYEIAARYCHLQAGNDGLKEFYVYHSVRLAAWGSSVNTLNEQPNSVFFEAMAARLKEITGGDSKAWLEALIGDLRERIKLTGYALWSSGDRYLSRYEGSAIDNKINKPLQAVTVKFVSIDNSIIRITTTDENGAYRIYLSKGEYKVTASCSSYEDWPNIPMSFLATGGIGMKGPTIQMSKNPEQVDSGLRGCVYEELTGKPIPNVDITFTSEDGRTTKHVTTTNNGQYSVSLSKGRYVVTATHPEYQQYSSAPGFFVVADSGYQVSNIFMQRCAGSV